MLSRPGRIVESGRLTKMPSSILTDAVESTTLLQWCFDRCDVGSSAGLRRLRWRVVYRMLRENVMMLSSPVLFAC